MSPTGTRGGGSSASSTSARRPSTGPSSSPRVREILEDAFTGAVWTQRLGQCLVDPAFRASQPIGQPWVEVRTEQVLLALLAHGDGVAARVLAELGVDLEKAAVTTAHVRYPQMHRVIDLPATWPPDLR